MKTLRKNLRKIKYHNRKIKKHTKKNKKGGKIDRSISQIRMPIVNIEIPNSEIEFAKSKLYDLYEYCGKYVTDDISCIQKDYTCLLRRHEVNTGSSNKVGRPYCDIYNKDLYAIVWHTHPVTSKFYPSTEDILMVKKIRNGEKIKLSIIYTIIGIWVLVGMEDDDLNDTDIDKIKKNINIINTDFYYSCYNGRSSTPGFNLQKVITYINENYLDRIMIECGIYILFEPYTKDQSININISDVRLDSLTP